MNNLTITRSGNYQFEGIQELNVLCDDVIRKQLLEIYEKAFFKSQIRFINNIQYNQKCQCLSKREGCGLN